jgi:hypothetical protein
LILFFDWQCFSIVIVAHVKAVLSAFHKILDLNHWAEFSCRKSSIPTSSSS